MPYTVTPRPRRARRRRRWPWALAGIFVLLGVIGAISGGDGTGTAPDPADTPTAVAALSTARSVQPVPRSRTVARSSTARPSSAKPVAKTSAPTHTVSARPRTSSTPAPPVVTTAAPVGCYPRSAAGNCVKPGQKCSNADRGMTGVDANGGRIVCRDNNGWRWEPV